MHALAVGGLIWLEGLYWLKIGAPPTLFFTETDRKCTSPVNVVTSDGH